MSFPRLLRVLVFALTIAAGSARHQAGAQTAEAADADEAKLADDEDPSPEIYRLTVSPAAEPKPALRYRLLVPPFDRVHADAAKFYFKAMLAKDSDWLSNLKFDDQVESWLELPVDQLPLDDIKAKIGPAQLPIFQAALREASRADYCDWGDLAREAGGDIPRPELTRCRSLALALCLLARLQIAEHRPADAFETLRWGYVLSRNLGRGPTTLHFSVGWGVESQMHIAARDLIAEPESPNLYWALTELAKEPLDVRHTLSHDAHFWDLMIPKLAELDRRALSPDEAFGIARKLYEVGVFVQIPLPWKPAHEAALLSTTLALEPEARTYLSEHGCGKAQIDAMPLVQRVLLYRWRQFLELQDETLKWALVPDQEGQQRFIEAAIKKLKAHGDAGDPFTLMLGGTAGLLQAGHRKQRAIDLLRVVEALRMYAAQHGHWPIALADITEVPIPLDAGTDKPFEYSAEGDKATLVAPVLPATSSGTPPAIRYYLTLRKPPPPGQQTGGQEESR